MENKRKPQLLLSSDTLTGYGLDLIFEVAKKIGFDGIDLATWKNFDAWNESYVSKLAKTHNLPVKIIQVSSKINVKEMEQAFDLCDALGVKTITMNAPGTFNFSSYNFITTNIKHYHEQKIEKNFAIINPKQSSLLFIPKYRFGSIIDIIKKHKTQLALDICNIDEEVLENQFLGKTDKFAPYMSVVYLSDKDRGGKDHLPPGDGILKIPQIIKSLEKNNYTGHYSVKIDISKKDLSDTDKVELILEKAVEFIRKSFKKVNEE